MIVLSLDNFAAKRRTDQEDLEQALFPTAHQAIEAYPVEGWYNDLLATVAQQYLSVFHAEGGTGQPSPSAADFTAEIRASLDKTEKPTDSTPTTISTWLATAILNAATQAAAATDEEFLLMEWVTMHDDSVRETHRETNGQQRPTNEPFDVAGTPMRYPGDSSAPIELWINCRCAIAPILGSEAASLQPEGVTMTATETETETVVDAPLAWHGVIAPEGVWSGDGRQFATDSLTHRDLPLPLTWQKSTDQGHDGSVVVGMISSIERVGGLMQASGTFLTNPEADEVVGLLAVFGRFGVSVDADDAEFEFSEDDNKVTFTRARIASASIVAIPAFAEAYVALGPWTGPEEEVDPVCDPESADYDEAACEAKKADTGMSAPAITFKRGAGWITNPEDTKRLHDYWTKKGEPGYAKINWGVPGDFNRCRALVGEKIAENSPEDVKYLNQICAQWHYDAIGFWPGQAPTEAAVVPEGFDPAPAITLVAGGATVAPAAWFENPNLSGPTHLQVTPEGRVFGHIAEWTTCHIGYEGVCVSPPQSASNYAYFATGSVLLDNGSSARTGVISLGSGHARDGLRPRAAVEHYDSTSAAVADVTVGEDDHGIWCAGWTRPGVTEEQVIALRASDVSGDWREFRGEMEMVAALAVNVGGFPLPSVGVENGLQVSLVAAGRVRMEPEGMAVEQLADEIEKRIVARQERRDRMRQLAARVEGA